MFFREIIDIGCNKKGEFWVREVSFFWYLWLIVRWNFGVCYINVLRDLMGVVL